MTTFDWIIVLFVLALASWGFRQGAVLGFSSLAGFLGGTWIGTRLAGELLDQGNASPYTPLMALAVALVIGGIIAELTVSLGYKLRVLFTGHVARKVDGTLGAVLLASIALGIVWVGAAALNQSRAAGELSKDLRQSAVVRKLNSIMPPSGALLNALARIDPFPQINGPATTVAPPSSVVARDPEVRRAAQSVVRVLGTACGYGVEGSGWVARPGVIVTNAHVIAGQTDTEVHPGGGDLAFAATPIWFDSRNDIAILSVPGLATPAVAFDPRSAKGASAAIIGFPENGPLDIQPARLGQTEDVISRDVYGNGPIRRSMTVFRGLVRHGNSGGPVVDDNGVVRTTVFATGRDSENRRGYGVPGPVVADALRQANPGAPAGTGACA